MKEEFENFIFKMERPRQSTTTAQSSLQLRSSPYLNGMGSIAVRNSPRVFAMSYKKSEQDFGTCGLNNINRKQHMSDFSLNLLNLKLLQQVNIMKHLNRRFYCLKGIHHENAF